MKKTKNKQKKNFLKFGALFLSALCSGAVFGGCGTDSPKLPDPPNVPEPPGETEEVYTPVTYESNGEALSSYRIVIAANASAAVKYAADILQTRVKQAAGLTLEIVDDGTTAADNEIVIGKTSRSECEKIDYDALGNESYKVSAEGKKLVIAGNERGALYGVYAYLEACGFRFYTPDTEAIPDKESVFVPEEMVLEWTPAFEYREAMYSCTWDADWAVSQKINSNFCRSQLQNNAKYGGYSGYIGGGKWLVHTFSLLLPDSLFSAHPEYFSMVDGKRQTKQPCLSNEGAYQEILKNALSKIASEPNGTMLSISENDNKVYCTCDTCQASYEEYGVSGTFFRFLNRIAGDIGKKYPNVKIDTLSYAMSKETPKNIQIADNIIVRVCPSTCNLHTSAEECEQVKKDQERILEWNKICKNLYVYFYPINWGNLYAALPSYESNYAYVKFFAEQGVNGVYAEGYSKNDPEFAELKAYLMAKLLANPMMSKAEYYYHYHDFIAGYYGDAAEYIEAYHARTKEMIDKKIKADGHIAKWFEPEENFDFGYNRADHTYDMTDIDYINDLWQNAVESTFGKTLDHVKKSRIHWTYIELYCTMDNRVLYGGEETREELYARNEELYRDILKYGATRKFDNAYDISTTITDFTMSPKKGKWLRP